ncbi:hypothetical protein BGX38DRAFT_1167216 [Terfezia claveryi]|nr:hypothetical protein BGX38DRAFT_1167216 [Terfezia claveryi]
MFLCEYPVSAFCGTMGKWSPFCLNILLFFLSEASVACGFGRMGLSKSSCLSSGDSLRWDGHCRVPLSPSRKIPLSTELDLKNHPFLILNSQTHPTHSCELHAYKHLVEVHKPQRGGAVDVVSFQRLLQRLTSVSALALQALIVGSFGFGDRFVQCVAGQFVDKWPGLFFYSSSFALVPADSWQ